MRTLTQRLKQELLTTEKVELIGHRPYSPNLAPNGFFLFMHIKNKLRGQRSSACFDNACFGGTSIEVKYFRKLYQAHAKV